MNLGLVIQWTVVDDILPASQTETERGQFSLLNIKFWNQFNQVFKKTINLDILKAIFISGFTYYLLTEYLVLKSYCCLAWLECSRL